jgi:hypothetical protein
LAGYFQGDVKFYFAEGRIVTYLSTLLLFLIASYSTVIFREIIKTAPFASGAIWVFLASAFCFAAVDEFFMVHENIDFAIHRWTGLKETAVSDRLDDIIVLFYALFGAAALFLGRRNLVRFSAVKRLVVSGFALAFGMIALDILTNRRDFVPDIALHSWLSVVEDTLKVVAETLFLIAVRRCWTIVKS